MKLYHEVAHIKEGNLRVGYIMKWVCQVQYLNGI